MALLAFIELTTPAMLGGLAMLSLPVIAHFMNRHARRRIVFPSLLLLRTSVATQSMLFRLRRWILLLLRCLAVAMIAMAFARPMWLDADTKSSGTGDAVAALLLIDTSVSTAQQSGGVRLIHGLRSAAVRSLDSLDAGTDLANIVYASAQPHAFFPRMSPNLPALRKELGQLAATYERGDLSQAITMAGDMLATHKGRHQLVILSDLQQSNWEEITERSDLASLLPRDTRVTVIDVSPAVPGNIALSSPRHFPTQPLIDQPIQLVASVNNFSQNTKQVRVDITVDGQSIPHQTLTLAAGEQRDVVFNTVVEGSGVHEVVFKIPADGLEADNRAYLVLDARNRIPVVIVSDDDRDDSGTASYFLSRALAPHNDNQADRYAIRHLSSLQLTDANLSAAAAVFVGYVGELSPTAAEALIKYANGGGGVMFFCGQGAVHRNLMMIQKTAGEVGVIPWEPRPARNFTTRNKTIRITSGKWQSRFLREFDTQSQIVISQIPFRKRWTAGPVAPDAQVLLTFSDDTPALASRQVGAGQFLLANFSPAPGSSNLGKYGTFVALIQILAKQLSPAAESRSQAVVGESYRHPQPFSIPAGQGNITVTGPMNEPVLISRSVNADQLTVHVHQTKLPGFYHFMRDGQLIASAAINVDKREHNLSRIDRDSLVQQFEAEGMQLDIQTAEGWKPLSNLRGKPLWGWFFMAGMVAVGMELLCLGIWKR